MRDNISPQKQASALLLVLTAIALLSLVILGVVQTTQFNIENYLLYAKRDHARRLAESGLAFALHPQIEREDPLLDHKLNSIESFKVTLLSEGALLNINTILAQKDLRLLRTLFTSWDLSLDDATALADALADWVDSDSLKHLNGAEQEDYEALGRTILPKNRPFQSIEEMSNVLGIEELEKRKPDWRNFLTVWSEGPLDLNEASAELIAIAAEVGLPQAETLVQYRTRVNPNDNTELKPQKLTSLEQAAQLLGLSGEQFAKVANRLTLNSQTFRIKSVGKIDHFQHQIEIILRRNIQPAVYLFWKES